MLFRISVFVLAAVLSFPDTVLSQESAPNSAEATDTTVVALEQTLRVPELLEVMRLEGLEYGTQLEDSMFDGQGGARWQAEVERIYDEGRMSQEFNTVLSDQLSTAPDLLPLINAFFTSDQGKTILALELEARRALLDNAVEEAAKVALGDMIDKKEPRLDLLREFAQVNGLIEANVMGAMNANLAFYKGMAEGGALGDGMTEGDMLAEVWGQEAQVRADTEDWLYPYLALAYQPLSDEDLKAYISFSQTPAGQKLNAALSAAFDAVFVAISGDLGAAAARQINGQDI